VIQIEGGCLGNSNCRNSWLFRSCYFTEQTLRLISSCVCLSIHTCAVVSQVIIACILLCHLQMCGGVSAPTVPLPVTPPA